ncbi:MAG: hypothetical protein GC166_01195 [Alphaproteobacteria bacterium]|nr:hypothetical protein [Alphaproteobacteria bacterium]
MTSLQTTGGESRIEGEIVRIVVGGRLQYADGAPLAVLIASVLGGVIPALGHASLGHILLWLALVFGWAAAGLIFHAQYTANSNRKPAFVWHRMLVLLWAVHGVIWGALPAVFWNDGNPTNQALVCTLVLGALVSAYFLLSASRLVFVAHTIPLIALTEFVLLGADGVLPRTLAVVLPLFAAIVTRDAWSLSGKYQQSIRLHLLNEELAQSLSAAKKRAEEASRTKSQFLANMSHELRTPLNAILGFSEMIASRMVSGKIEKHYEYAGLIHRSAMHLLTLINDVLDLSKIEAGFLKLDESDFDLRHLLQDSAEILRDKAEAGGLNLVPDIGADIGEIHADERAIKQIVLNLLSNALKFTGANGTITLFAHKGAGGCVVFGVRDTGIGIAKEDQARVFENFGQARHDITTADRGTGLGLSIVKGLVEAHGGDVTLHSVVGTGTTVTVTLPPERALNSRMRAAS